MKFQTWSCRSSRRSVPFTGAAEFRAPLRGCAHGSALRRAFPAAAGGNTSPLTFLPTRQPVPARPAGAVLYRNALADVAKQTELGRAVFGIRSEGCLEPCPGRRGFRLLYC